MRLAPVVFGLVLVGGCGSKPDSSDEAKQAQQAVNDLDAQLTDPPAEIVAALGAEPYPGAKVLKSMSGMRGEAGAIMTVDYVFFTPDAPEKVRDFYEAKLTGAHRGDPSREQAGTFMVKGTNQHGDEVTVQAQSRGVKTTFHFAVSRKK